MQVSRAMGVLSALGEPTWEECDWDSEILGLYALVQTATSIQHQWLNAGNKHAIVFITNEPGMAYQTMYAGSGLEMRPLVRLMNMFFEHRTFSHRNTAAEQTFVSVCLTATTQATGRGWGSMRACTWDDIKFTIRSILTGEQEWKVT